MQLLIINEGISLPVQKKEVKTIANTASKFSSRLNEGNNEKFLLKILTSIESNKKNSFLNHVIDKGCCSKITHLMPALH